MPLINVYLREGTTAEHRQAIASAIQKGMIDVLNIPDDDYFQVTHELDAENLIFDRNFFGVARSDDAVIVRLSFNARPAAAKQALFEAIADNIVDSAGLDRNDLFMTIVETAPENWWANARTVDAVTGTDSRMSTAT